MKNDPATESSVSEFSEGAATVKKSIREAGQKAKSKAQEVAADAREQGGRYLEQNKSRTANCIGRIGESLRQTADRFEEEEDPNIAHYTRVVADKVETAAAYVNEHDVRQMQHDAGDFARHHPAIFFGSMFTLGLVTARFLKASQGGANGGADDLAAREQPLSETFAPAAHPEAL